jgi:hypothetical protein
MHCVDVAVQVNFKLGEMYETCFDNGGHELGQVYRRCGCVYEHQKA